jgi:hypothetical protein
MAFPVASAVAYVSDEESPEMYRTPDWKLSRESAQLTPWNWFVAADAFGATNVEATERSESVSVERNIA